MSAGSATGRRCAARSPTPTAGSSRRRAPSSRPWPATPAGSSSSSASPSSASSGRWSSCARSCRRWPPRSRRSTCPCSTRAGGVSCAACPPSRTTAGSTGPGWSRPMPCASCCSIPIRRGRCASAPPPSRTSSRGSPAPPRSPRPRASWGSWPPSSRTRARTSSATAGIYHSSNESWGEVSEGGRSPPPSRTYREYASRAAVGRRLAAGPFSSL